MNDFLAKIFIKNYKNCETPEVREQYGVLASVVGVIVNILLATFKLIVGLFSGSIAVVADSLNNYSDAGSSIVSFVSFKIAAKPADRDHPFGHARIEYVCSLIVSFLILLVGVELLGKSINTIFAPSSEKVSVTIFSTVVLSLSIIFKLWLACFYKSISKKINSSVLAASATDSVFDAISTLAVFVANVAVMLTDVRIIDSIVGIVVAIMILIAGIRILNETKNSILGEAPTEEVVNGIKEIVAKYPEILGIHDMLVHNYGPNHFIASFHAEVDGNGDIYALHDSIDLIEREIIQTLGILCTIHMDPIVTDDETVNSLREMAKNIVSTLYEGATIHDFRMVAGHTHTNLIFDIALPFEVKDSVELVVKSVSEKIQEIDSNYYSVITVDRQ